MTLCAISKRFSWICASTEAQSTWQHTTVDLDLACPKVPVNIRLYTFSILDLNPVLHVDFRPYLVSPCQFQIKSSPLLGRYLQATLDLHPGDRIARESPLIVGPKLALAEPICLGCHKPLNPNLADNARCPRCFWPACSARCSGLSDAHTHAPECAILKLGCETLLAYNDYK